MDVAEWNILAYEFKRPLRVGVLHKKGKSFQSGWRRRLLVLHNNILYLYKGVKEEPHMVLCLDESKVDAVNTLTCTKTDRCEYCSFGIRIVTRAKRTVLLKAPTQQVQESWIRSLNSCRFESRKEQGDVLRTCKVRMALLSEIKYLYEQQLETGNYKFLARINRLDTIVKQLEIDLPFQQIYDQLTVDETVELDQITSRMSMAVQHEDQIVSELDRDLQVLEQDEMKGLRAFSRELKSWTVEHKTGARLDISFTRTLMNAVPVDYDISWKFNVPEDQTILSKSKSVLEDTNTLAGIIIESSMQFPTILMEVLSRNDKIALGPILLRTFGQHHRLYQLLKWAVDMEISSSASGGTIFRSDGATSRLFSIYNRKIGANYIAETIGSNIKSLCKVRLCEVELDPIKDPTLKDAKKLAKNAARLMGYTQECLQSILDNLHKLPASCIIMCTYLYDQVEALRFSGPSSEHSPSIAKVVIGNFFFLRFICPAISSPETHGMTQLTISPDTRRILVLVTKLMSNVATGVLFGQKEPHMSSLNAFIISNASNIDTLYNTLTAADTTNAEFHFSSESAGIFTNLPTTSTTTIQLAKLLHNNINPIEAKLHRSPLSYNLRPLLESWISTPTSPIAPLKKYS